MEKEKSVTVEVRNAGFVNKGAELMLCAIVQQLRSHYPCVRIAKVPSRREPFSKRLEYGLFTIPSRRKHGLDWASLVPRKFRDLYGFVVEKDVDVILDASGFLYGDSWPARKSLRMAALCKRCNKRGTKIALLPQAFGPFRNRAIRTAIRRVVDIAELVFARDRISYEYLIEAVGERETLSMAPDFTHLVNGEVPAGFNREQHGFCLIPNYKMIDRTPLPTRKAYLPFLAVCAKHLLKRQANPFILVHEDKEDLVLARALAEEIGENIPILAGHHALAIKGIIGACNGLIGSRYHGLVSALSQRVPSLCAGWSHKYQMLFEEYGFPEGILDVHAAPEVIRAAIDSILEGSSRAGTIAKLTEHGHRLKKTTETMWQEIFSRLFN